MERFSSVPPFAVRDLGRLPIRGRVDGIDVIGLEHDPEKWTPVFRKDHAQTER
jgi:adenylate cyclase